MAGSPRTTHCEYNHAPNGSGIDAGSDEHERRSSECPFFALSTTNKKAGRGRKSRASKASRMSTQSNITTLSENMSMMDVNGDDMQSLKDNTEIVNESQDIKTTKKGGRSKKAAAKSNRKGSTAQQDEMVVGSSFVQPEDDIEVGVDSGPVHEKGNKKRTSDAMDIDNDPSVIQTNPPPSKRRATRSSILRATRAPISTLEFGSGESPAVVEISQNSSPPPPIPKVQKGGRKRASTTTRKASAASTASKASLRATVPDDEEVDAALEADLDRPLTDDEVDPHPPTAPKAKGRRLTRTRPGSRNVTASTAPVRRTTRASTMPVEHDSVITINTTTTDPMQEPTEEVKAVEIASNA
ncbi:MAG: hypothetical protein Q9174_006840, partial [Haloplaca sp. 1 TL-2023]